jgi:hypothetical protein
MRGQQPAVSVFDPFDPRPQRQLAERKVLLGEP